MVKKTMKILLICLVFICAAGCIFFGYISQGLIGKTEIQYRDTESEKFQVAVISDTQLPPTQETLENDSIHLDNLKKALTVIKNNDVDMILFAGDIGDLGTRFAFQTYMAAIEEVFGADKPIVQTILGNHDYWNKNAFTAINHLKAFEEITSQSPWTHYVVNGYHFIGASPNYGSMQRGYRITAKWLGRELEKASADSDGKPIFVMTHNHPVSTCYGSGEWGDKTLNRILEKYPNVINLSGHTHYSLLDERAIWQGAYTVINTQSLSYTELEEGKVNGTIPPNANATPMGYIMEFKTDQILLRRMNFADGNMGYEEKQAMQWSFSLPYKNDGKYGFEKRKAKNAPPKLYSTKGTASRNTDKVILTFAAGTDDDFVHSYKVVTDDKDIKYFFSDFYNGIENMGELVSLELENDGESHTYKIYAIDSWNAESDNYITIHD